MTLKVKANGTVQRADKEVRVYIHANDCRTYATATGGFVTPAQRAALIADGEALEDDRHEAEYEAFCAEQFDSREQAEANYEWAALKNEAAEQERIQEQAAYTAKMRRDVRLYGPGEGQLR